jgi:hypothetical protein
MGNDNVKPIKPLLKFDIEISCDQIFQHLSLQRDRKINELAAKERDLRDKMKSKQKGYEDTVFEISSIVNIFKYIKAIKIIMRYCQILKEHSIQIVDACQTKKYQNIRELIPYFEGLVWSKDKLNLTYIKEFNNLIYTHFGNDIFDKMKNFNYLDKELLDCFNYIEPTPYEIQDYLKKFLQRYEINNFVWPQGLAPVQNAQPPTPPPSLPPNGGPGGLSNNQPNQYPPNSFNPPQNHYPQLPDGMTYPTPTPYDDDGLEAVINSLKGNLNISPDYQPNPGNTFPVAPTYVAPIPPTQDWKPEKRARRQMKKLDNNPEAYTDDNDDVSEYQDYEDFPLSERIEKMRNKNV